VDGLPLALALATGLVAAVNPCGFALLPAYLSMLVAAEGGEKQTPGRAVGRALALTAAMTTGFVAVFGLFGVVVVPLGGALMRHLPWATVGIGLALAVAGGWLLSGRHLPGLTPPPRRGPAVTRTLPSMALFGAAYALASLGCTIGPFLAVVVASLRTGAGSVPAGIALFGAYALGMGLTVGLAAVTIALARTSLLRRIRRAGEATARASGVLLVLCGCWVAYYGWHELRVFDGDLRASAAIRLGHAVQMWVAATVQGIGVVGVGALLVGVVAAVGAGTAVASARRTGARAGAGAAGP